MRKAVVFAIAAALVIVAIAAAMYFLRHGPLPQQAGAHAANATTQVINQGEYLARAGDCVACHTVPNGKPFAGGRAMATPFGNLYVPNITPDDETGIGKWNADEFYRMMHTGISRDGTMLYPAMPFAQYTKVTRADSDAIFAYLMSVPPVRQENRKHELRFPFNKRELLIGWRTLYFKEGEYVPDPKQSAQWNRGAYLVEGLGHCSMCHTAINVLGGSKESQEFEGGMIPNQNWYAPSLTSNREAGLGDWDIKDIADLLQVGVSQRATVYGPMAEVVYNSLQYLTDDDATAMAVYLKSLPQARRRAAADQPGPPRRPGEDGARPQGLREAVRALPRRRRQGVPAGVAAAGRQPVDHDGLAGQLDPHGAQRRLSAGDEEESEAARHAAVLAHPQRRRGRRRRHLHPRRLEQQRHAGAAEPGQRAAQAAPRVKEPADARTDRP